VKVKKEFVKIQDDVIHIMSISNVVGGNRTSGSNEKEPISLDSDEESEVVVDMLDSDEEEDEDDEEVALRPLLEFS